MAEEQKEQPAGDKGPQPAIDLDAIRGMVSEGVRGAMEEFRQTQETQPDPTLEHRESRRPEPTTRNPLADVIGPLVNPALQHLGTEIADAKDAALFYVENPRFLKHKKGLEDAFNTLKKQGTPMTRDAVAKWYMGQHYDAFRKEDEVAAAKAAEDAKAAADQGPGASRTRTAPTKDPHDMSDEELAKSLEGVAF